MPSHEHRWVWGADVALPTRETVVHGSEFHRLEYCVVCGGFRIKFGNRWRYWYSDATKEFLSKFDGEEHRVLKIVPPSFRLAPPAQDSNRLGRGLKDIASTVLVGGAHWKSLFKKGKPDAESK